MKFKRFIKPSFLKEIGRELLGRFFEPLAESLRAKGILLPGAEVEVERFYEELAAVAKSPDALPDDVFEALWAVEGMANPEGQERLERAKEQGMLGLEWKVDSSHGEIAMQTYLEAPALLAAKYNELVLLRLASFEYFGTKAPVDRTTSFAAPTEEMLERIAGDVDAWCKAHNRGSATVRVEVSVMDGEYWFLIRHGDTYARTAKIEGGRMRILHYRPAKDDVVVYSPRRDEIRIHTGTKGEREMYQGTFGARLFGNPEQFSVRKAFSLEPLRRDGVMSLDCDAVGGIERIVLRECEISWGGAYNKVTSSKADDIFLEAEARGKQAIPEGGRLVKACFDVYFDGGKKPRRVQLRPPNGLRVGRYCDVATLQRWLSEKGFRDIEATGPGLTPRLGSLHLLLPSPRGTEPTIKVTQESN
ncbi:MAG: uncharacterized protein JWM16_5239 [Verrucomicrobiales bacterium]|nr:uncharacterized protein [Verrucomicrobiales bacterium]